MPDRGKVYIRRRDTKEAVYTMTVSDQVPQANYERWLWRVLRATDLDQFFVDDHEIEFEESNKPNRSPGWACCALRN